MRGCWGQREEGRREFGEVCALAATQSFAPEAAMCCCLCRCSACVLLAHEPQLALLSPPRREPRLPLAPLPGRRLVSVWAAA